MCVCVTYYCCCGVVAWASCAFCVCAFCVCVNTCAGAVGAGTERSKRAFAWTRPAACLARPTYPYLLSMVPHTLRCACAPFHDALGGLHRLHHVQRTDGIPPHQYRSSCDLTEQTFNCISSSFNPCHAVAPAALQQTRSTAAAAWRRPETRQNSMAHHDRARLLPARSRMPSETGGCCVSGTEQAQIRLHVRPRQTAVNSM